MELFKRVSKIDFMGLRKYTATVSIAVTLFSIYLLFTSGLNFGLDFTGGTQIEVRFEHDVAIEKVRETLEKSGFEEIKVQKYGSAHDVLLRLANSKLEDKKRISKEVSDILSTPGNKAQIREVQYIGAEVGEELGEQSAMAIMAAIFATMVYIALRFEYRFAVSSAVALCHVAIVVLGIFSLFQVEFNLATLAAVLAIMGYQLNDTIVIFDRVRENFRKVRTGTVLEIMNLSINQTLSRTILTSFMTLLVVVALLIYGGESLFGFSLALTLGILIGTYSSIYVAGSTAIAMGLSRQDLVPRPKAELDDMP